MSTIFSKIIAREVPAHIIYEDDIVLAFLDIRPVNDGHTLVIPKVPAINIFDVPPDTIAHMTKVGQKIALAQKASGLADGVNLVMNNEVAAGQEVFHIHLHVIPRKNDDHSFSKPNFVIDPEERMEMVKEKMCKVL